jgi:UDP-N-acetylglucosamine 2-epimerase
MRCTVPRREKINQRKAEFTMPTLYLVVGARPNFMKIAPIVRALQAHGGLDFKIIHTGQHYDREMNDVFFEELGIDLGTNITLVGPQAYMAFLHLWKDAAVVLTDSGGLQEETTALGVPCITIRENTERPITVEEGTNELVGTDPVRIVAVARKILRGEGKQGRRPQLWDGKAAERIVAILVSEMSHQKGCQP